MLTLKVVRIVKSILQKPRKEIMHVWIKIVVVDTEKIDTFLNIQEFKQYDLITDWILELMEIKEFRISPGIQSGRI